MVQAELLIQIEAFLRQHGGMSETAFGVLSVNDGKLVRRIRDGRNMTIATIERVRKFMADQHAGASPQPSEPPASKTDTPKRRPKRKPAPLTGTETPAAPGLPAKQEKAA